MIVLLALAAAGIISIPILHIALERSWATKEAAYRETLTTPEAIHRHEIYMRYLPQSALECEIIEAKIARGEL